MNEKINNAISILHYLELIYDDVQRITDLVQENPYFFDARPGDSTIKCAADFLEKLVKEYNQNKR